MHNKSMGFTMTGKEVCKIIDCTYTRNNADHESISAWEDIKKLRQEMAYRYLDQVPQDIQ